MISLLFGCVESVSDTQTSTTPTIEVYSPKTNDTVKVGKNVINYQATDGTGGEGLSFYELYVNKIFAKKYVQNTDGTNPAIYLEVDSTLIRSRINYTLKVYNKTGKSKEGKLQENIFVKDKEPQAPTNLLLTRYGSNSVILKWNDNSGNEKGFELWRRDVINGTEIPFRRIKVLPSNTISTIDGNISQYQEYSYYVVAYNESGYSTISNVASTGSLPDGPWNLQAEAIGSSSVHLKWVDFALNEVAFQIERTDPFTSEYKIIKITEGPDVTEYYDNSVSPSASYNYRVAYFTTSTLSAYSNVATVTTFYSDVTPPSGLSAGNLSGNLQISWKDNSRSLSKGTVIERRIGTTGEFIEIGSVAADQTTFIDYSPVSGIMYYRVRQILGTRTYTQYSDILRVQY
ncbi:hypothetical protein C0389_00810 [bacterium]|nr:hypothetical protein [bacterium]